MSGCDESNVRDSDEKRSGTRLVRLKRHDYRGADDWLTGDDEMTSRGTLIRASDADTFQCPLNG